MKAICDTCKHWKVGFCVLKNGKGIFMAEFPETMSQCSCYEPLEGVVTDLVSFLELRGCSEETLGAVKKNTYKYTDCGAWLVAIYGTPRDRQYGDPIDNDKPATGLIGFRIGSIVEGVDWDCTPQDFLFPFPIAAFWDGLKDIEAEANDIWNDTHGCEHCPPYFDAAGCETHYHTIDKDCPYCKGKGMII